MSDKNPAVPQSLFKDEIAALSSLSEALEAKVMEDAKVSPPVQLHYNRVRTHIQEIFEIMVVSLEPAIRQYGKAALERMAEKAAKDGKVQDGIPFPGTEKKG